MTRISPYHLEEKTGVTHQYHVSVTAFDMSMHLSMRNNPNNSIHYNESCVLYSEYLIKLRLVMVDKN